MLSVDGERLAVVSCNLLDSSDKRKVYIWEICVFYMSKEGKFRKTFRRGVAATRFVARNGWKATTGTVRGAYWAGTKGVRGAYWAGKGAYWTGAKALELTDKAIDMEVDARVYDIMRKRAKVANLTAEDCAHVGCGPNSVIPQSTSRFHFVPKKPRRGEGVTGALGYLARGFVNRVGSALNTPVDARAYRRLAQHTRAYGKTPENAAFTGVGILGIPERRPRKPRAKRVRSVVVEAPVAPVVSSAPVESSPADSSPLTGSEQGLDDFLSGPTGNG